VSEKGRAGRLFEGLANAILERGRPRLVSWLQARFGPSAELGALRFEDARVHLEDARVPLTPKMRLSIARASIEVVSVPPPRVALSSLEGELLTDGGLRAEVRFAGEAGAGEAWVRGLFSVVRASWPGAVEPLAGALRLNVTSERWSIDDGSFTAAEAKIGLCGRGDIDADGLSVIEEAKLTIEGARAAPFEAALRAITDRGFELGAFADAIVAGTIVARGAHADVALTARSALGVVEAKGAVADAVDLQIDGEIVVARALAIAGVDARWLPVGTANEGDDRVAVTGTAKGPARSPRLAISTSPRTLHFSRGEIGPLAIEADVAAPGGRPAGTFVARAWGTEIRGDLGDAVVLRFEDASARLIHDLLCIARVDRRLELPATTRISGVVTVKNGVAGDLAFETEGSAVIAALRLSSAGFSGTTLRGRLSLADARTLGLLPDAVRPEGAAKLEGAVKDSLVLEVTAKAAIVDLGPLVVRASDVSATVIVGDGVRVENGLASAHGGRIIASGRPGAWNVRTETVRIEELSPAIAREVRGLLTGNARIEGGKAAARIRLDHPVYPAIARLAPHLSKLGLSLPPEEGTAPLDATLAFEDDTLRITSLAASVDSVTVSGAGAIHAAPERALSGRAYASVSARWLQTSAILAIPAFFTSNVTVPISFGGTLREPKIDADTSSVLKNTIGFDPIGAASDLASAFGSIWSPPKPRMRSVPPAKPRSDLDVTLDRILDHDPESEALIGALVDRGIDPDEFERLLDARRRARSG
jgi:hypothetical protein